VSPDYNPISFFQIELWFTFDFFCV